MSWQSYLVYTGLLYFYVYRHNWTIENEEATRFDLHALLLALIIYKDSYLLQMNKVNCSSKIVSFLLLGPMQRQSKCPDKTRVYSAVDSCWQKYASFWVSSSSSAEPRVAGVGNKKSSNVLLLLIVIGIYFYLLILNPGILIGNIVPYIGLLFNQCISS